MDLAKDGVIRDVLEALEDVGYSFVPSDSDFEDSLRASGFSKVYTDIVAWLTSELKQLLGLDEVVNAVDEGCDVGSLLLEISSFLKEINCPFVAMYSGPVTSRLASFESKLQLLDFLSSELQAARMLALNRSNSSEPPAKKNASMLPQESSTAASLKAMLISLGLPKPPENLTSKQLFTKILDRVKEQLSQVPPNHLGQPLFTGCLNDAQWLDLERVNNEMNEEYRIRADVLLKRLDVTVQSFTWSDRVKKREEELTKTFRQGRQALSSQNCEVSIADLLSARDELSLIEKTCGTSVRQKTQTSLNKLLMGRVPDRGGRTSEIEPPPPEMPPWQKRTPGAGRGGGAGAFFQPQQQRNFADRGGGARGSGRGGRVQGAGWDRGYQDSAATSYQDQRGGGSYHGDGGYAAANQYQQQSQQQHGYAGFDRQDGRHHDDYSRGRSGQRGRGGRY